MKKNEIKERILKWNDFYGGDIIDETAVKKAKTKKELRECLNNHSRFLETQHLDAMNHIDNFINDLGLNFY